MTIIISLAIITAVFWGLLTALGAAIGLLPVWLIPTMFFGSFVGFFAVMLIVSAIPEEVEG